MPTFTTLRSIRWTHTPWERTPKEIIAQLHEQWHTVSSEEFYTDKNPNLSVQDILKRDTQQDSWSDMALTFANVTNPKSLGVGYELGYAEKIGKPVICFYQQWVVKSVSAMITWNPLWKTIPIKEIVQLQNILS